MSFTPLISQCYQNNLLKLRDFEQFSHFYGQNYSLIKHVSAYQIYGNIHSLGLGRSSKVTLYQHLE